MYDDLKQIKTLLIGLVTVAVSVYNWQTFSSSLLKWVGQHPSHCHSSEEFNREDPDTHTQCGEDYETTSLFDTR